LALDPRLDDVADISDLSGADLALVVELQRKELDRLLRENAQLHARVNQLIGLQEREQVLRQQMQSMMGTPKAEMPTALLENNSELAVRAQASEARYERLKGAMALLITAIERQNTASDAVSPDAETPG
jgi:hypothetical protein